MLLSYLEYLAILPAKTFLSHFLSLLLAEHPELVVARFAYPPPTSPLARVSKSTKEDEMIVTKIASLNFLQLTLKNCQAGVGDGIDKVKGSDGKFTDSKGKGKAAWIALLGRYEKEIPWLRRPEVKEVSRIGFDLEMR